MNSIKTKPLTLKEVEQLCATVAKYITEGDVVDLSGDLGAGKTTFVAGFARYAGLEPGANVTSPTYVLHHIYPAKFSIHHIDLYRLENQAHVLSLGFEEFLGEDGVAFIEWFEKFPNLWKGPTLHIQIEITDIDHRRYSFAITGESKPHWIKMLEGIKKWKNL